MFTILIDSGTTHSRIRLVNTNSSKVEDAIKLAVGVRDTAIAGNNHNLKTMISEAIKEIINKNSINKNQIKCIIASGMITSNLGLYEVPHISAPANLEDFVRNCKIVTTEDFLDIPCIYVPGMKNAGDFTEPDFLVDSMDMLRGEEVETYGLLEQLKPKGKGLMVLPGSHTKYILVDENQTLVSSYSTLGGEIIHAIRSNTILSNSIDEKLIKKIDETQLISGYKAAKKVGLTRVFYHIRLVQLFSNLDNNERANYFVGAVLESDIKALKVYLEDVEKLNWIIVGGTSPLRKAFIQLLKEENYTMNMIEATDEEVEAALVFGAQKIGDKYFSTFINE